MDRKWRIIKYLFGNGPVETSPLNACVAPLWRGRSRCLGRSGWSGAQLEERLSLKAEAVGGTTASRHEERCRTTRMRWKVTAEDVHCWCGVADVCAAKSGGGERGMKKK